MATKLPLSLPDAPPRRPRGRPHTYDPAKHDRMVEALLTEGGTDASAAYGAGISPETFALWYRKGDDPQSEFNSFTRSVDKGKARFEASMLHAIRDASNKSWQAAAWLLERRYPGRYARTDRVEHSGPDGTRLSVTVVYEDVAPMPSVSSHMPQETLSAPTDTIDGVVREMLDRDEFGASVARHATQG